MREVRTTPSRGTRPLSCWRLGVVREPRPEQRMRFVGGRSGGLDGGLAREARCDGSWCDGCLPGLDWLVFLLVTPDGALALVTGPYLAGALTFLQPTC